MRLFSTFVSNPHPKGYGRKVALRLADQLGRSVPKPRDESVTSVATTVLLSLGLAGVAGGAAYLGLTEHGNAVARVSFLIPFLRSRRAFVYHLSHSYSHAYIYTHNRTPGDNSPNTA